MMPWLRVNQSRELPEYAVPRPSFSAEVQRGSIPGAPNAELLFLVFMVREAASPNRRYSHATLRSFDFAGLRRGLVGITASIRFSIEKALTSRVALIVVLQEKTDCLP